MKKLHQILKGRFILSLLVFFLLFSIGCYSCPKSWIAKAGPAIAAPIAWLYPQYQIATELESDTNTIVVETKAIGHIISGTGNQLAEVSLKTHLDLSFLFAIPLIYFPLLFAWPDIPFSYRIKAAVLALPILILAILADGSTTLLYFVEEKMSEVSLAQQFRYYFTQGMNRGGRQVLALLIFSVSIAPIYLKKPLPSENKSIGRNAPCPCGSGKKYKWCCLR